MIFFDKDKKASATQPKRQSIWGVLFNPHLGESIRPMGESLAVFVNIIAMLFAMNGLFPKDHPALKGEAGARLTLSQILNTAWHGLSFTPAGLPKVLLFFAVAGAMVLSVLAIIIALMLAFIGHAHAQSVFTPINQSTDLAYNWITFLFDPTPGNSQAAISNIANVTGQTAMATMPTSAIQSALSAALGVYSNAILVIAAFILFYHLASMIVETAHHGQVMGKNANQIWAPIRLVVAIGLLVPVSSAGLNCGQYIVIYLARAGSSLASNVWSGFSNALQTNGGAFAPVTSANNARGVVATLTSMYACEYAYNYEIYLNLAKGGDVASGLNQQYINNWAYVGVPAAPPSRPPITAADGSRTYHFTNNLASDSDLCGSYTIPAPPTPSDPTLAAIAGTLYSTIVATFNSDANSGAAGLSPFIGQVIQPLGTAGAAPNIPLNLTDAVVAQYEQDLASDVTTAISSAPTPLAFNQAQQEGWVAAGAWFNQISSEQAGIADIVRGSMPAAAPPNFDSVITGDDGVYATVASEVGDFNKYISGEVQTPSATPPTSTAPTSFDPTTCLTNPVGCLLGVINYAATKGGVWNNSTLTTPGAQPLSLGIHFNGANPLLEMAAFGHNSIETGLTCFNIGIAVSMAETAAMGVTALASKGWSMLTGRLDSAKMARISTSLSKMGFQDNMIQMIGKLGGVAAGFLFFLGMLFFTMGAAIAFVVPLLPFMHFFFNTITWISCIAESIIAIPLVALAHLTPKGDGLSGDAAKGAYYMIFSMVLRPVLMIFGLICGLLIMYVAAGLLNALYAAAVGGSMPTGKNVTGNYLVISDIMFTLIYVIILYSVANHAFALIGHFPNKAMEWMGGKGLSGERMGDPGHISGGVTLATGYITSQGAQQLQQAAQAFNSVAPTLQKNAAGANQKYIQSLGYGHGRSGAPVSNEYKNNPTYMDAREQGQRHAAMMPPDKKPEPPTIEPTLEDKK